MPQASLCCGLPGSPDGVKGVGGGLIAVHGLAFGPKLLQPLLVENFVEQLTGLAPEVRDHRKPCRRLT
jgi:hypothetical protein